MNIFYKGGRELCLPDKIIGVQRGIPPAQHIKNQTTCLKHPVKRIVTTRTGQSSGRGRVGQIGFVLSMIFFVSLFSNAFAQSPNGEAVAEVTPLQIGDEIPDELWNLPLQVVNHPEGKETITLSEYKDKLIILDFWATWCGSCITALKKIHHIQKIFPDDVAVVAVTTQDHRQISAFDAKTDFWDEVAIPSIVQDSILKNHFLHKILSHVVWISREGLVSKSSGSNQITEENINDAIRGDFTRIEAKNDILDFDRSVPLFIDAPTSQDADFNFRSLISGYLEGAPSVSGISDFGGLTRKYKVNSSIMNLYLFSIPTLVEYFPARIKWKVRDRDRFFYSNEGADQEKWNRQHLYCFDVIYDKKRTGQLEEKMKSDLDFVLGLRSQFKEVELSCLIFKRIDGAHVPIKQGDVQVSKVLRRLEYELSTPVLNESDIECLCQDIAEHIRGDDLERINQELKNFGLILDRDIRVVRAFVIEEV